MQAEGTQTREELLTQHVAQIKGDRFFLSQEQVKEIMQTLGYPNEVELLEDLVVTARGYARPIISHFHVGVAGLTDKGNIYLGVNIEFPNQALNQSIHGEQCMVSRILLGSITRKAGEERLVCFAVSAAPCGHCRQFLLELANGADVQVVIGKGENAIRKRVVDLLPDNFSPKDLGNTTPLLGHGRHEIKVEGADALSSASPEGQLLEKAVEAASFSYSPYTNSPAGVALRLKDGSIFQGAYVENVAYNPSLSPLQSAMTSLVAGGKDYADIVECYIVEKERSSRVCQETITRLVLADVAPNATVRTFKVL